jgi:diacylglycerol kinase (ATP)
MSKSVLIANPKTGRYASRRRIDLESIQAHLKARGFEVEIKFTASPGDATRIAAAASLGGIRDVIVAGGDGTINEALQGLVGSNTRLGILPSGTANVLARELRLPLDAKRATEVIGKGKTRRIHLGCAVDEQNGNKRYFVLMAGIGLDASVVRRVNPRLKKRLGKAAFWISGLSHLARWQPSNFDLQVNGQTFSATFAIIGKAASYGGNLAVTPRARLERPEFEICVISSQSRLRYLQLLSYVMRRGVPTNRTGVFFLHATQASVSGDAPVQVDGEVIGHLPMSFEIAPETVEVFVP